MPTNIDLSALSVAIKKNSTGYGSLINTIPAQRNGFRPNAPLQGILFQENFDAQPDYTATMHSLDTTQTAAGGYTIPDNWTAVYQGTGWSPEKGFPDHHAVVEITSNPPGRGGAGKCFRGVRESNEDATGGDFQSDGQLIKAPIDPNNELGTNELYVEFWLRFDEKWFHRNNHVDGAYPGGWSSKIFRCASWTPGGNYISGGQRDIGPEFYWNYNANNFGIRNALAFRGGPPANLTTEDNYKGNPVEGFGDSGNYNSIDIAGQEIGGTDPQLLNLETGLLLAEQTDLVTHEALFGPSTNWTKMAFYVKMNSAPGVADGLFSQYINGHRIRHRNNIPWVWENTENIMVKWNHFAIGGNDYFAPYAPSELYEDYYYIDDIVVTDYLPNQEDLI